MQLEEQLDKQAVLKKELEEKFQTMEKEKDSLYEKIDELNKEKQEMNTKLVSYMQENMELIDRLEKLSAEKVSSAESIEIVESLTQQEKLEIEAYQKNLEFTSDKEHVGESDIDPNSELNESVSKLTEDSSELLERIELFTVERREVMEKMESLLSEKEHLLEKLNKIEIEKNEFERKCTEKDHLLQQISPDNCDAIDGIRIDSTLVAEYKTLVDNQKIEIEHLNQEILKISEENAQIPTKNDSLTQLSKEKEGLQIIVASLNEQFFTLHKQYEAFLHENTDLKNKLKKKSETVFEKDSEEQDIKFLQLRLIEYEYKITEDAAEMKFLQETVEDNKNELIKSADQIANLTSELSAKHSELQVVIEQLNNEIDHKNNHVETIDLLSGQLQELKSALSDNFKELQRYEELNTTIAEADELIDMKDSEIDLLRKEQQNKESRILSLEEELKHKDQHFKQACQQLKDKCVSLESKIQVNSGSLEDIKGPFEARIQDLENECKKLESKQKEHVDKMKKIAANLKKKAATCQELESKLTEANEKWENESKEKQMLLEERDSKISSLVKQLQEKEIALSNLQIEFGHKRSEYDQLTVDYNKQLQQFGNEQTSLQNKLAEYMSVSNNLQGDVTSYQNEIKKLNSQIENLRADSDAAGNLCQQLEELQTTFNTTRNALEAKIQEKEMYIENIESENAFIKERIAKLNEGLAQVEDRRRSLEQFTLELGAELEAKSIVCEEVSLSENILEKRLESLIQHDNSIENKLKEMTLRNHKLNENVERVTDNNLALQAKLSETEMRLKEKENDCEKMFNLENDSIQLREVISSLEHDMKKLHVDYENKLFEKTSVIESMEQELNTQIDELNNQRRAAVNQCELLTEKLQEYSDNEQILQQDLENLKEKLENMKVDLEKQSEENVKLNEINSNNTAIIEQLQNRIMNDQLAGDPRNIQLEIFKLREIITEKDNDIENYQRQNMQLQMSMDASSKTETQNDVSHKQIHDLTNELKVYQQKITDLEKLNEALQNQIEECHRCNSDLQAELTQHKDFLIRATAEDNVDQILSTAQHIVTSRSVGDRNIEIEEMHLTKSNAPNLQAEPQLDTAEELLKKIKTLEFMLYTVEKEKDDALTQCHGFSNELTRLVYEREGLMGHKRKGDENKVIDISKVESEIISDDDRTKQDLRNLEYTQVDVKPTISGVPVEEDIIQRKSAYLCYADDGKSSAAEEASGWGVEDDILRASLEAEIVQDADIPITQKERQKLRQLEYAEVRMPSEKDRKTAVCEKPIDPKAAYLCYPDDVASVDIQDAFASEEDGWGWNAEELKLEAKHQQALTSAVLSRAKSPDKQRIRELEDEKAKLVEDMKTQQQKVAKLIKKLKEMKAKNEALTNQLQQKSSGDFDVLDVAIQEELNAQIKNLETKLKEVNHEKTKDKLEKEGLLKRIDTLVAANERMIEMKEKQDNEIQMLNCSNRQLTSKLDQFDWGQESPRKEAPKTSSTQATVDPVLYQKEYEMLAGKIEELNSIINDLTIDNEEMQLLLEEQRKLRLQAEKAVASMPVQDTTKTEPEYSQLLREKEEVSIKLIETINENKALTEKLQNTPVTAQKEYLQLQVEKDDLDNRLIECTSENKILNVRLKEFCKFSDDNICPRLESIQDKVNTLIRQKDDVILKQTSNLENLGAENEKLKMQLNSIVESTTEQIKDLELLLSEKQSNITDLNTLIETLTVDKQSLQIKLREISGVLCSENADQLEGLGEKLEIIVKEVQNKNKEISELNNVLNIERIEFEQKLTATLEQLAQEWAERVEQRGANVAESWKLHLESRESEFTQLEQTLRSELTEIFNKSEALLMENNDLQKKVELLVQEKQAATSDNKNEALQQILSDRQSEILALSQQLQEVSVQLEARNNEIVSMQQIIDAMHKQNHELTGENNELHTDVKRYEQLNKQWEMESKDFNKITKQNIELNAQLQIENQEIDILKQTTEGLRQELSKLREELNKEKSKYMETMELQQDIHNQEMKLHEIIKLIDGQESETFDNTYDELLYLEQKIILTIQNLHDLRIVKDQLSNEKQTLEESYNQMSGSALQHQQTNEKLISELSDLRETIRTLTIDLDESTQARNADLIQMNNQIKDLELKYEEQLRVKHSDLEILQENRTKDDNEKTNLQLEIQMKISEVNNLQLEIESLHNQNQEIISKEKVEKSNLELQLESKLSEINELDTLLRAESAQIDELRQLLATQTQQITDLKQELEKKTEDYNTIYEELESTVMQQRQLIKTPERRVHFKEPISESKPELAHEVEAATSDTKPQVVDPLEGDLAGRAELDLALYMLHQRDVRCEELTLELMHLLEERDTLQLRLSNAIRINEELRGKFGPQREDTGQMDTPRVLQSSGAVPRTKSSDIVLKATGTELAMEATEADSLERTNVVEKQQLDNK